jgi:DNA-binding HxlR family transcriptional regulator
MRVTTRAERLDRILFTMSDRGDLTLRQIAENQGLRVTPYLTDCVNQLVTDGYVKQAVIEGVYPTTYTYHLTDSGKQVVTEIVRLYGDI